jgi:DNA-binding response OmpR family regulator
VHVVIGEDSLLLREGLARLLAETGHEVAGQAGDADELLRKVGAHKPELAIVDVRMPPSFTDEGIRAALAIRERWPEVLRLDRPSTARHRRTGADIAELPDRRRHPRLADPPRPAVGDERVAPPSGVRRDRPQP